MPLLFPELEDEFARAARLLGDAHSIAVIAHVKPDADAVGSACGLAAGLCKAGHDAQVFIGQSFPHPGNLETIPGIGGISYTDTLPEADLVVTVDCASVDRTGAFRPYLERNRDNLLVIDHHETNPGFGATNLVVVAESTTTLVRELFTHMGIELDHEIAHCLYAGLVTDTGNFRWGTPRMHLLAAELIGYGLDTREIVMQLMDSLTAEDLRLLGGVLAAMERREAAGRDVCVLTIPSADLEQMSQTAVEAVIDYARTLRGSDVGVVFKEQRPERWSVSLRSSVLDVSLVAQRLGGGGHVPAAGLSLAGPREEALAAILDSIVAEIHSQA